jgi:hypothetical protein
MKFSDSNTGRCAVGVFIRSKGSVCPIQAGFGGKKAGRAFARPAL